MRIAAPGSAEPAVGHDQLDLLVLDRVAAHLAAVGAEAASGVSVRPCFGSCASSVKNVGLPSTICALTLARRSSGLCAMARFRQAAWPTSVESVGRNLCPTAHAAQRTCLNRSHTVIGR